MKACKYCGCPPPKKGEIGLYCSACGNELLYVNENGNPIPRVTLLNCAILTTTGYFNFEKVSLEVAKSLAQNYEAGSAIGHEATAKLLSELLNYEVLIHRCEYIQRVGDIAIVFKLRGRIPEGKILEFHDIETIGYDFGILTRLA